MEYSETAPLIQASEESENPCLSQVLLSSGCAQKEDEVPLFSPLQGRIRPSGNENIVHRYSHFTAGETQRFKKVTTLSGWAETIPGKETPCNLYPLSPLPSRCQEDFCRFRDLEREPQHGTQCGGAEQRSEECLWFVLRPL